MDRAGVAQTVAGDVAPHAEQGRRYRITSADEVRDALVLMPDAIRSQRDQAHNAVALRPDEDGRSG